MKNPVTTGKRKAALFGVLSIVAFCTSFILAPLGSFTIWITVGATAYFLFLSIYFLIPHSVAHPNARRKSDPKADEMKSYIRRHTQILLGLFLGTILFVLIFLWFVL